MEPSDFKQFGLILERLSKQDTILEKQNETLDEILKEQKITNSRVTKLEEKEAILKAIKEDRERREQRQEKEKTSRRHQLEFLFGTLCLIVGGMVEPIGHVLGFW